MMLRAAANLFLGQYDNPGTRRAYRDILRPLVAYLGPDRPIDRLQPVDVVEYQQSLRQKGYADATVRKHTKGIKTFFNFLVRHELIDVSPARTIQARKLPTYISRDKAMTDDELERILDFVKWKPRDHALIRFLADTGCRAGGASKLRVQDLDLPNYRAVVIEKGSKTRPVAYGEACAQAIRIWLLQRPAEAGDFVFSSTDTPIKPDNISLIVRRACLEVGVRSLGSHSLRHRKGHQLADAKVAPSIAATALGHSDPTITLQHYYPADWESAEKELRKLALPDDNVAAKVIRLRKTRG